MQQSNFHFLENEFPILFNVARAAECNIYQDANTALYKMRQFVERLTEIVYEKHQLEFPYNNSPHTRVKGLKELGIIQNKVRDLLATINHKGNVAVHQYKGSTRDAKGSLYSSFLVAKWFYQTYTSENLDISSQRFKMPENLDPRHALSVLEEEYKKLETQFQQLLDKRQTKGLPEEKERSILKKSDLAAARIEMNEEQTRALIDEQLSNARWEVDTQNLNFKTRNTLPQRGRNMAIAEWSIEGKWADYALFIGTELYGIVEAKKYGKDIPADLGQAKFYAELVEEKPEAKLLGQWGTYKVPFLFSTNGREYLEQLKTKSGIWFLDVRNNRNRSRPLQGWFSPAGLEKLLEQDIDHSNKQLQEGELDYLQSKNGLSLRDYQIKAIQAIEHTLIEQPNVRRALLAMATGTGKTRTTIGLCYRLIKTNRFRRILFLVDRRMLAIQAIDDFSDKKVEDLNTFSETYEVKKLKENLPDLDTRLHFATVQSMVKRLFYAKENKDIPSIDTYDCIIVDEAHRGYLQDREMDEEELFFKNQQDYVSQYRRVLDYFDAFVLGLTATPALHTKEIFGKPVFTYSYREAVIDGFLADHDPPFQIKTRLSEEGIVWEAGEKPQIYDKEENQIIDLDELADELRIEVEGFNKLVITENFNRAVVQYLITQLDPEGEEKTLIFAARDQHADLVVKLLEEEFAKIGIDLPENAIQKITGSIYKPQTQLRRFKNEKFPNIVVTVDLLTTGIDVPPICNLVFLRRIKSRILFEQMLGRATRLCEEIGKESFKIYDAVRIYEALEDYSNMKPVVPNPKTTFVQLAEELDHIQSEERSKKQVEQIIAKLQRKKKQIQGSKKDHFHQLAEERDPEAFIQMLKELPASESQENILQYSGLWKFLDELRPSPTHQLVSFHEDEFLYAERGYGEADKPEDYLESFKTFIHENQNKLTALNIICTRPKELDRKSLKALKLALDAEGFNTRSLNTAWKEAKNEDIAADIITYIRTLALGSTLISQEERISRAIDKIRQLQDWNKTQKKWINRFEQQLLKEEVIKVTDLDEAPFSQDGGFSRLNKIFNNQLAQVIDTLNEHLYQEIA